jgi:glucose-1-phosphate thymidylyltransferase
VVCATQPEPLGTADAVLAAEAFAASDPFVLANADNIYPDAALQALADLEGPGCWLVAFDRDSLVELGNVAQERARDFAVVTATDDGRLEGIVEKPEDPSRFARDGKLWVSMNLYRFDSVVFDACRAVEPDPERGELELTAAVGALARSEDAEFRVIYCEGGVLDLTSRADVPAVARALAGRQLSF